MLSIFTSALIEGVQVYGDDQVWHKFYLLPEQPTYRVDENGRPFFKFLKYRFPVDRADGQKGGGFAMFDIEFTLSDATLEKIKTSLQERITAEAKQRGLTTVPPVEIAPIHYTKGTAHLQLSDANGEFVQRLSQASKPSLYGKNISSYSIELTPEGARLFEQAMQGKGGFVSVVYDLAFSAKLPPVQVKASFNADAFYQYLQTDNRTDNSWHNAANVQEALRQISTAAEARELTFQSADIFDAQIMEQVRNWATRTLDDAIEQQIRAAFPAGNDDAFKQSFALHDFAQVQRDLLHYRASTFSLAYAESALVEFTRIRQGTLPTITNLVDNAGNPIALDDYTNSINLDDPFFKELNIAVYINADFAQLPIDSVEVKLTYNGQPMASQRAGPVGEVRFVGPNDVAHFAAYVEENNWSYRYRYQVNYKGVARSFQSPEIETNETILTINVDDLGILWVDIAPGDLNFSQVKQAELSLRYADPGNGVAPIEQQFMVDQANPTYRLQAVIFAKRTLPYQYRIKYFMQDGQDYQSKWMEDEAQQLYMNAPFKGAKQVTVRAVGDLEQTIQTIFVELEYNDEVHDYAQTTSIALNSQRPFFRWEFPVIDENAGTVTYTGNILYRNHAVEPLTKTVTTASTLLVGEAIQGQLNITVLADLLDFTTVKLARVELSYTDEPHHPLARQSFVFSNGRARQQSWSLQITDKTKVAYQWTATYFLNNGARKTTGPQQTTDLTLILEVPA